VSDSIFSSHIVCRLPNDIHSSYKISNGWSVVSGWMKKGAQQAGPMWEKAKQVTADTVEATAPARSQFYDLVSDRATKNFTR